MQQNYQSYESLQNSNNSLDIDPTIKIHRPKTVNTNEQSSENRSFNRTSISSKNKSKENDSYNNFISRIKLNYNLLHPRQRIQTIILHSNLDKSMNMSDASIHDLKNNDLSSNNDDNLNTGFILDNSGSDFNNPNRRRTINHLNRVYDERLEKGEEEKNNQSAETKKNKSNSNFNNDIYNNMNKNSRLNLGSIFNNINDNDEKDKIFLSHNSFNDDKVWTNEQRKDVSKYPNNNFYLYKYENNPFLGQNMNNNLNNEKGQKYMNRNYISEMNNLSTNINTNNTNEDIFHDRKSKDNKQELISSFNYGINNNSLPNPRNSYLNIRNNSEEINNKSNNDSIEFDKHFTFQPKEKESEDNFYNPNNNKSSIFSFSKNNPNSNNFNNINENNNFTNKEENKSKKVHTIHNQKEKINQENIDITDNNNIPREEYEYNKIYENNKNNNIRLNFVEKGNKSHIEENDVNINKDSEIKSNISLTISDSDEYAQDNKEKRKGKNLCKSFLYGLIFGSTVSGIFLLKNEETRKYFFEKIKGINFNSIINLLKAVFSNPVEFFRKIFSNERMKDYLKIFGIALGQFFDFFESYDDWFRLIGIVLSVYLIWIIIKSFIKVFFKIWKYYN